MDLISAYCILNVGMLKVAKSLNILQEVKESEKIPYIKLKPNPYVISTNTIRYCQVISAHDLNQYKNKFHTIQLKENFNSWLDVLLSIDKGDV
ncbi:MAG: hypothetical protein HFI05_02060 [Lachnospiraceae bacterium]|nr:hypothetical protein [Lachnospiraceae bacterium]